MRIADAVAQAYLDDQTESARRQRGGPSLCGARRTARCAAQPRAAGRRSRRAIQGRAQNSRGRWSARQRAAAQRDDGPTQHRTRQDRGRARPLRADRACPPVRRRCPVQPRKPYCRRPSGSCAGNTPKSRASAPNSARWSGPRHPSIANSGRANSGRAEADQRGAVAHREPRRAARSNARRQASGRWKPIWKRSSRAPSRPTRHPFSCANSSARSRRAARSIRHFWCAPGKPANSSRSTTQTRG